ncbi:hypothetical protein Glove_67g119 [Diversispora epigaea]|uniref:Uncharacterized protein n=1 Tax=Diversispora epigaea TaxID=1348612 RepID=A0A397JB91_9GLOM|nr:hypothetical protein Glove_67g119 [Diversispora epigaea]
MSVWFLTALFLLDPIVTVMLEEEEEVFEYNRWWCKPCNSKHFQNNFNNWTSGSRFGTIHNARWIDRPIKELDTENQQWKRYWYCYEEGEVALKKFDNFVNFNDVLNEGITQDPETHSYMMVLEYAKDGNLREYLKLILILIVLIGNKNYDARVTHRPTVKELHDELKKYYNADDYYLKDSEIQIKNQPIQLQQLQLLLIIKHIHRQLYHRLLNYSNLPKPKNEENFERELEELTKSSSALSIGDSGIVELDV